MKFISSSLLISISFTIPLAAAAFSSSALAVTFVENRINCEVNASTSLSLRNGTFIDPVPLFSFAPFVSEATLFKRSRAFDGRLRDYAIELDVRIGNINVKRDFVGDFDFGLSNVVFAGLEPATIYATRNGQDDAFKYRAIDAKPGTALETDLAAYEGATKTGVIQSTDREANILDPIGGTADGDRDGGGIVHFAPASAIIVFPNSLGLTEGKLFFAKEIFDDDASNLLLSGRFDIHGGLPRKESLGASRISQSRREVQVGSNQ